jgi:hypothetical protein
MSFDLLVKDLQTASQLQEPVFVVEILGSSVVQHRLVVSGNVFPAVCRPEQAHAIDLIYNIDIINKLSLLKFLFRTYLETSIRRRSSCLGLLI